LHGYTTVTGFPLANNCEWQNNSYSWKNIGLLVFILLTMPFVGNKERVQQLLQI